VNIIRIEELFNDVVDGLDRATYDWSAWDDITYQFIQDGNQEYIDNNLDPATWKSSNKFIYFGDLAGNLETLNLRQPMQRT